MYFYIFKCKYKNMVLLIYTLPLSMENALHFMEPLLELKTQQHREGKNKNKSKKKRNKSARPRKVLPTS